MKNKIIIYAMALLCLAGCHTHHHPHEEHEASNIIHFSDEMRSKVDFTTAVVEKGPFGQVIHTVGRLQPRQGQEQAVTAKASGIISFVGEPVEEGTRVNKGQTLFYIESDSMADGNLSVRFAEAKSAYELAGQTYERKRVLAADRIVSESELQAAKADLEQKEVVYNSLKANFFEGKHAVVAPASGYLSGLNVLAGMYVEAGRLLACISHNSEMQIVADVQLRYFGSLQGIEDAVFKPMNSDATYSLRELGGRVVSYGRALAEGMTMLPVTFAVPSIPGLPAGAFLDTYIKCRDGAEVLTVPVESVMEEMGSNCVYVEVEPEHFEKRQVTIGVSDGRRVEIVSGLAEGETVAAHGAVFVRLAGASGKLDAHAGHVH